MNVALGDPLLQQVVVEPVHGVVDHESLFLGGSEAMIGAWHDDEPLRFGQQFVRADALSPRDLAVGVTMNQ